MEGSWLLWGDAGALSYSAERERVALVRWLDQQLRRGVMDTASIGRGVFFGMRDHGQEHMLTICGSPFR